MAKHVFPITKGMTGNIAFDEKVLTVEVNDKKENVGQPLISVGGSFVPTNPKTFTALFCNATPHTFREIRYGGKVWKGELIHCGSNAVWPATEDITKNNYLVCEMID